MTARNFWYRTFMGALLAWTSQANANENEYAHFVGKYAYESTPIWVEIEIAKEGDTFVFKEQGGERLVLRKVDGNLVMTEKDGDEICLTYDKNNKQYSTHATLEWASSKGRKVPITKRIVKVKEKQGKDLEKELGVNAASLVRKVRADEEWIHQFDTLYIKTKSTWTKTPAGIKLRKNEIKDKYPEADLSRIKFWGLEPQLESRQEWAVTEKRIRQVIEFMDKSYRITVWDGHALTFYEKYYTHKQEKYYLGNNLENWCRGLFGSFAWARSRLHVFWWDNIGPIDVVKKLGHPEEYVLVGKAKYRGSDCYVLECRPRDARGYIHRWYVGCKDKRLRGTQGYSEGELDKERWTDDYIQVAPGWWFPLTQGYDSIRRGENGLNFLYSKRKMKVERIRVNETLPDDLFEVDMIEGVEVIDDRFGAIVKYKHKANRTKEEWTTIYEKARQRSESDAAEKRFQDDLIGKSAPSFPPQSNWLNSEPLTWADLRSKVVILEFWAHWCGPCWNELGAIKKVDISEKNKIVVIGVHVPSNEIDDIKKVMKKHNADGPVCIDVSSHKPGIGFGQLSSQYGVKGIPYSFVVGPDGKIVGHGRGISSAFPLARKTLNENK